MLRLNFVLGAETTTGGGLVHFGDAAKDKAADEAGQWHVEAVWPDWWPHSVREELEQGGGDAGE